MSTLQVTVAGVVLSFVLIIFSGIWLSHLGKPYNTGVFTVHKLVGLAVGILLGAMVYSDLQSDAVGPGPDRRHRDHRPVFHRHCGCRWFVEHRPGGAGLRPETTPIPTGSHRALYRRDSGSVAPGQLAGACPVGENLMRKGARLPWPKSAIRAGISRLVMGRGSRSRSCDKH